MYLLEDGRRGVRARRRAGGVLGRSGQPEGGPSRPGIFAPPPLTRIARGGLSIVGGIFQHRRSPACGTESYGLHGAASPSLVISPSRSASTASSATRSPSDGSQLLYGGGVSLYLAPRWAICPFRRGRRSWRLQRHSDHRLVRLEASKTCFLGRAGGGLLARLAEPHPRPRRGEQAHSVQHQSTYKNAQTYSAGLRECTSDAHRPHLRRIWNTRFIPSIGDCMLDGTAARALPCWPIRRCSSRAIPTSTRRCGTRSTTAKVATAAAAFPAEGAVATRSALRVRDRSAGAAGAPRPRAAAGGAGAGVHLRHHAHAVHRVADPDAHAGVHAGRVARGRALGVSHRARRLRGGRGLRRQRRHQGRAGVLGHAPRRRRRQHRQRPRLPQLRQRGLHLDPRALLGHRRLQLLDGARLQVELLRRGGAHRRLRSQLSVRDQLRAQLRPGVRSRARHPGRSHPLRGARELVGCFSSDPTRTTRDLDIDGYQASWTQAWTPILATQVTYTAQVLNGFQSNPYRTSSSAKASRRRSTSRTTASASRTRRAPTCSSAPSRARSTSAVVATSTAGA